jgi:tetratricopeptide (TPR) repeat protein
MLYLHHAPSSHSAATQRALRAADGYLFLGLAQEALAELDTIPDDEKDEASVLLARNRVLLHLGKWRDAEQLAALGAAHHPEHEEFTVQRAFALQKMNRQARAMDVLLAAPEWIRRTGILHYNLACYEAQLGDLKTAKQCINAAIQINEAMRKNAKVDPDLQALEN